MTDILKSDTFDYTKLSIVQQGFEELHYTDSTNYQLNQLEIEHNLGYVPIALVYYFEGIGSAPTITASTFVGDPLPAVSQGYGSPWSFYSYTTFSVYSDSLVIYKQSSHTADSLNYHMYFKYFLFSQTGLY